MHTDDQWQDIYNRLSDILKGFGTIDPSGTGDGDVWIRDDDWGNDVQHVCVFSRDFARRINYQYIVNILMDYRNWEVRIVFDFVDDAKRVPMGIRICFDKIVVDADRDVLPDQFPWHLVVGKT